MRRLANKLARDLWQAELGRGYGSSGEGTHLGQLIVISKFRMAMNGHPYQGQIFENYRWTAVQKVYEKSKVFPWRLVLSMHVSVMQDTKVPHHIYRPTKIINIDYMKDIHDFCLSMRFSPVFVRSNIAIGESYSYIAVDREDDALLVANYCISLGL